MCALISIVSYSSLCPTHTISSFSCRCTEIYDTFSAYSSFESRYDNADYVENLKRANVIMNNAKKHMDKRSLQEIKLRESGNSVDAFMRYISSEKTKQMGFQIEYIRCLYERAICCNPLVADLWISYIEYVV